jgi:arsenical pump membrane protein
MAILNALAIGDLPGARRADYLAALIGGDLGPRLLPTGSLAGLLWLKLLSRAGLNVSVRQFMRVGALVTLPALLVSLLVLYALE